MTINRAFIKAYRHDEAEPEPASPAGQGAAKAAAPRATASVDPAATTSAERSALYGPRPADTGPLDVKSLHHPLTQSVPKRPLSAFIAPPVNAPAADPLKPAEFLRPGTTIASFQWPAVCRALAQQSGPQLDQVAERLAQEAGDGRSLIGVLGLFPGRGATTTALCLAARLARPDRRVVLVDGNFCRPRLAAWLEAVPTTPWQDVLKRGGSLADAIIRARDDRFDLLALDARKTTGAERLVAGLQAIVTAGVLRHAYDVVLIDTGSFFDAESQPVLMELVRNMGVDAALAVTGPQPADARDLGSVAAQLGRSGCELLGTIENRLARPQAA